MRMKRMILVLDNFEDIKVKIVNNFEGVKR